MLKLYLYIYISVLMSNPIDIDLLGKNISEIPSAILTSEHSERQVFKIIGTFGFHGKSYNDLGIIADPNGKIEWYSIFINEVDRAFYDAMNEAYGYPTGMYNQDPYLSTTRHETVNGIRIATVTDVVLKECFFEEKPTTFVWDLENYSIEIRHVTLNGYHILIGRDLMKPELNHR